MKGDWKKYFKVVGVKPGRIIITGVCDIDLASDDLNPKFLLKLIVEHDFENLVLTSAGFDKFYPKAPKVSANKTKVDKKPTFVRETKTISKTDLAKKTVDDLVILVRNSKSEDEAKMYHSLKPKSRKIRLAYFNKFKKYPS